MTATLVLTVVLTVVLAVGIGVSLGLLAGARPSCSPYAVRLLQTHGRDATRLTDGMLEWRLADLPVVA